MSLRYSLIATAAWMVLVVIVSIAMISYVASTPEKGPSQKRASSLGQGMGVVACIGLAAIWLPYAAAVGARKRNAGRSKKKKKRSS